MSDTYNAGIASFRRSYELCPIFLVNGIAAQGSGGVPGGGLPITSILQSSIYPQGITGQANSNGATPGPGGTTAGGTPGGPSDPTSPDSYFAHFVVEDGGSLIDDELAEYPFANMSVAANAVISQPLEISLRMICPADPGRGVTYPNKQAIITSLQTSLQQHIDLGGYFIVATPAFIYPPCLLRLLEDGGDVEEGGQVQHTFLWHFRAPLITLAQAQGAQNAAMNKISSQVAMSGDPPGNPPASAAVADPGSNVVQNVVPAAQPPISSNVGTPLSTSLQQQLSAIAPILPGAGSVQSLGGPG